MAYEVRLRLIVTNGIAETFDHDGIHDVLLLNGEQSRWSKGDAISDRAARKRPNHGLAYKYFVGHDCDPVVEIERLIDKLEARGDAVVRVLFDNPSELSITIRLYAQDTPPLHFTASLLARIRAFNLDIDIDLYVLPVAAR